MTLFEFGKYIRSTRSDIAMVTIYSIAKGKDILTGCTMEHAIDIYGGQKVDRITAENNTLVIWVEGR